MPVQLQIAVPANSATLLPLDKHYSHFGEVLCPFCHQPNIVAGPTKGVGMAFSWKSCDHNQGACSGGDFDITFLFRGSYL